MTEPTPWAYAVPYLPFRDGSEPQPPLPAYVRPHVAGADVLAVPAPLAYESARSILRLYISDLEWLILPEAHRDRDGYTFTNVSYYSTDPVPRAFSQQVGDVCRTQLSLGMVRQLALLAHAVWCAVVPLMVPDRPPPRAVAPVENLSAVLSGDAPVTDSTFDAIISRYPRALGQNPDLPPRTGYETEFLLFADMLRFAWCHEWFHGLAGHVTLLRDHHGVAAMGEVGAAAPRSRRESAALHRALEFQADVLAVDLLLDQIFMGEDLPSNLINIDATLGSRLGLLVVAFCTMTAYWAARDLDRGVEDRVHPPVAVRYLRLWDQLRWRLTMIGNVEELAAATAGGQAIVALGARVPLFADFADLHPVLVETSTMRTLRKMMQRYRTVLTEQRNKIRPFLLDHGFRDAYPVVGPAGDGADSVERQIQTVLYWINIPEPDQLRVACHYPVLFTATAADLVTKVVESYRVIGDEAAAQRAERAAKLLAEMRRIGPFDLPAEVQLAGLTGQPPHQLSDWLLRGRLIETARQRSAPSTEASA